MGEVTINGPKTPVTEGSSGLAVATTPNVCKMPGPPAPFFPTPLPNIGKSGDSPKGYSKKVLVKGKPVALRGASFGSTGDMASKGTGGGLLSSNTHGPTKFVAPGALDVKFEGKSVHLLGDAMINNCGPSGSPPNAATLAGILQAPGTPALAFEAELQRIAAACEEKIESDDAHKGKRCKDRGVAKHKCCDEAIREQHGAERGQPQRTYSDGAFDKKTGQMIGRNNPVRGGLPPRVPRTRSAIVRQAIGFAKKGGVPAGPAIAAFLSGKQFPDVVVSDDASQPPGRGNTGAVYDFKFPCPKTKRPTWGKGQKKRYRKLLTPSVMKLVSPTMVVP